MDQREVAGSLIEVRVHKFHHDFSGLFSLSTPWRHEGCDLRLMYLYTPALEETGVLNYQKYLRSVLYLPFTGTFAKTIPRGGFPGASSRGSCDQSLWALASTTEWKQYRLIGTDASFIVAVIAPSFLCCESIYYLSTTTSINR